MPRAPARRSAARGCCRASAPAPRGSTTTPATARRQAGRPGCQGGCAGVDVSWEIDLSGRLRAGAAAAAADAMAAEHGARGVRLLVMTDVASNYFTLVGALRQLETVRAISAAHDETLRLVTARQRVGPRLAVRRRARPDRRFEGARGDPAARDARRGVAAPHRRADRRPGGQCRGHRAVERRACRSAGAARTTRGAARAQAGPARAAGAARRGQCAPAAGRGGVFPAALSRARCSAARAWR